MAKAEAADFLRPSLSSYKVSLLSLTAGQKKSQGQELREREIGCISQREEWQRICGHLYHIRLFSLGLADLDNFPKVLVYMIFSGS